MKKIVIYLLLLCCSAVINANQPASSQSISRVIFLGDSLTDDGKLYSMLFSLAPKSPPYFKGRFSNGPTWAEYLAKYYYDKYYIGYKTYAVGAATATMHIPRLRFTFSSTSTLDLQVYNYLADNVLKNKSKDLVLIWIGSNDYLYYLKIHKEELTDVVVNKTLWGVKKLLDSGVKNIVVLNLPDSSFSPFGQHEVDPARLHDYVMTHNRKLAAGMENIIKANPQAKIVLIDVNKFMIDFLAHVDVYNKKYHMNVTNLKDACWKGGFFEEPLQSMVDIIQKAVKDYENKRGQHWAANNGSQSIDALALAKLIKNNPELNYVYNMNKSYEWGLMPCRNPENYLFWDGLHPTEVVHKLIAEIAKEQLSEIYFKESKKA